MQKLSQLLIDNRFNQTEIIQDNFTSPLCEKVASIALNIFHSILAAFLTYTILKYVINASVFVTNGVSITIGLLTLGILRYLAQDNIYASRNIPKPVKPEIKVALVSEQKNNEKQVEFVPTPQNQIVQPSPKEIDRISNDSGDTPPVPITPLSGSVYDILDASPSSTPAPPYQSPAIPRRSLTPSQPERYNGWWIYAGYGTLWGNAR